MKTKASGKAQMTRTERKVEEPKAQMTRTERKVSGYKTGGMVKGGKK